MPYDEELAGRIRALVTSEPELARWVRLGVAYAGSPEPKRSGRSG
jgi:hypothetical protein